MKESESALFLLLIHGGSQNIQKIQFIEEIVNLSNLRRFLLKRVVLTEWLFPVY